MRVALILFLTRPHVNAYAQELNCSVNINYDQVSGAKPTFEALQRSIAEYLNNTAFTDCIFDPGERIECQIMLVVKSYDNQTVSGELQLQSMRPVFNSTYTTTILNLKDNKIAFEYRDGDPLVFSVDYADSQLTALLNFYAYLMIAMDFDSFSPLGGEKYWEIARQISMQYQNSVYTGWSAFEDNRNRGAIVDAFTQPSTKPMRDLSYVYHRTGLDQMALSPEKGRYNISASLATLGQVQKMAPMSVALSMFKDAKLHELVNLYSGANQSERQKAYDILTDIYPAENTMLNKIRLGEK